jgi:hypothetical protein
MPVSQARFIELIAEHEEFNVFDFLEDGSICSSDGTNEFTWNGGQWSWTNGQEVVSDNMSEQALCRLLANVLQLGVEDSSEND